jgi:3-phenylpropionate/trans-cinnamate dioxygenase ferredoxin reductase subunit
VTARTFVIVGASLAGASAAATLREEGFEGRVVLVGWESQPPYERPPLSKEYLRGEQPFEKALVHPEGFYEAQGIETRFGMRAHRVDPSDRVVELEEGERIPYHKVLVATGSRNRRLPVPGAELEGVFDLRTVADADRIRAEVAPGRRAVLVGMGFIGAEVAASLRQMGVEVAVVHRGEVPLSRALGTEVGRVLADIHRDHGVEMHFGERVAALEGSQRVEAVRTDGGQTLSCDFVVTGVGVEPVTEVVAEAGVEVEDGIVVDDLCRTRVEDIYAAGDVTSHHHPLFGRRIRVEHWSHAITHGAAAARSMLGKGTPYTEVPWFWSEQYDHNLQYAGYHTGEEEMVVRGSLEGRSFVVFFLRQGRVVAAAALDRARELRRAMELIRVGVPADADLLRDEGVDLRALTNSP